MLVLYFLVIVFLIFAYVTNCWSYILTVTALDRANAEDAFLPIPKVFDSQDREKTFQDYLDKDATDGLVRSSKADSLEIEGIHIILSC